MAEHTNNIDLVVDAVKTLQDMYEHYLDESRYFESVMIGTLEIVLYSEPGELVVDAAINGANYNDVSEEILLALITKAEEINKMICIHGFITNTYTSIDFEVYGTGEVVLVADDNYETSDIWNEIVYVYTNIPVTSVRKKGES